MLEWEHHHLKTNKSKQQVLWQKVICNFPHWVYNLDIIEDHGLLYVLSTNHFCNISTTCG